MLGGTVKADNIEETPPVAAPSPPADPDEVDLSTHPSATRTADIANNGNQLMEADIHALLCGNGQQPAINDPQPGEEDPMMRLLQQMMGGVPGAGGTGGEGENGLPPGLAAMLGAGGMAGTPGMGGLPAKKDSYRYLWKIVHVVFALVLGIYVTATSHAFNGDVSRGGITGEGHEGGRNVFWAFATAELVLQSSRFFWERGQNNQLEGWLGIVGNTLPEPYKGYLLLAGRYSGIWSTVVEDGMVIIFIVGLVAWWKGAVG